MFSGPVKPQKQDAGHLSIITSNFIPTQRKTAMQQSASRMASNRTKKTGENSLERMPPEIICKILLYLDAGSLFCIGFVNKHFHELSNNNAAWYQFYIRERTKKKKARQEDWMIHGLGVVDVQGRPKGHWRNMFFKEIAGLNANKWRKKLQRHDPYSGLPCHTEEVLRSLCITWEIIVTDGRGRQSTFEQSRASFSSTAVFMFWGTVSLPPFNQLTSLELHGVLRVPLDCPAPYRPVWKSIMSKIHLKGRNGEFCGSDKIVKLLYIGQGVTVGIWQDHWAVAFIIVNLHNDRLVERSLPASVCPHTAAEVSALFDDLDPEYGLHGYTAYIELHNTVRVIMSGRFPQLFCRRDQISDGYLPLEVISEANRSLNTHLVGDISLPWRTEALHGTIKDCCMMNLTVWDEAMQPFWCVSAPVVMTKANQEVVSYDFDGESFSILYQDSGGRGEMRLKWVEDKEQYFVVNLVLYISISKVNKHFGRNY
ncbi:F-box only protein 15-like isoform X2 [Myxocyprinus asiaticus]|uniref:F-box only protein 15-like isoform X2 n=1 Tax=Myxocyprinus asiaticus TaxID=70543 RepID=UPI00222389FE|nr:F-box only protein 15-like isoform X2 [Myxocyprinus asiaticus]